MRKSKETRILFLKLKTVLLLIISFVNFKSPLSDSFRLVSSRSSTMTSNTAIVSQQMAILDVLLVRIIIISVQHECKIATYTIFFTPE